MNADNFVKVDSHAHLTCDQLYQDVDEILNRAHKVGVTKIINVNTDEFTLERGFELKKKYNDSIFNVAATHPHDVDISGESFFITVEKYSLNKEFVAIGETGLDYYYKHSDVEVQKKYLKKYLDLAMRANLPVIVHCRGDGAFEDLFTITREFSSLPILVHCFTGSMCDMEKIINLGWYISISGIVTFNKSSELRAIVKEIPLNKLLIETDSPYLSPVPFRNQINEPALVAEVAIAIANEKNINLQFVCESTTQNAIDFFKIS